MAELPPMIKIWEEETTDLYQGRPRSTVPEMPNVGDLIQVVTIPADKAKIALIYLALVVVKADNKMVTIRAIASAVSILFGDTTNFTGSPKRPDELTGLDVIGRENISATQVLATNFEGAPDITVAQMEEYLGCDPDELGGFFGNMFLAGTKRLTTQNATAFNEKRLNSIMAAIAVDPHIFIPGSPFLEERVLNRVYAAFTSLAGIRAQLIRRVALKMGTIRYGPVVTFTAIFMLLIDSGMGTLKVIKECSIKAQWVREIFPEIKPELEAADQAQQTLRAVEAPLRPYIKAIFGSQFVPVSQAQVGNLLGISLKVMSHYVETYRNFRGGFTTPQQDHIIAVRLGRIEAGPSSEGI